MIGGSSIAAVPIAAESASGALAPGLLTNLQTFFAPTVSRVAVALQPGLLTNSNSFYAPTVAPGAVTLTPSLLSNSNTFYAPTVSPGAVTLLPGLLSNGQTFYGSVVTPGDVTLTPSRYDNGQTFYSPTVTGGDLILAPPLFINTQTFYTLAVLGGSIGAGSVDAPSGGGGGGGDWKSRWQHKRELRDFLDKVFSPEPPATPEKIVELLVQGKVAEKVTRNVPEQIREDFSSVLTHLEGRLRSLVSVQEAKAYEKEVERLVAEAEEEAVVKSLLSDNIEELLDSNTWELLCRFIHTNVLHAE